jgi:hypothetical protein
MSKKLDLVILVLLLLGANALTILSLKADSVAAGLVFSTLSVAMSLLTLWIICRFPDR